MRKTVGFGILIVIQVGTALIGETTEFVPLWARTTIYVLIACLLIAPVYWFDEIRGFFNPAHRIVKRARDAEQSRENAFVECEIDRVLPLVRKVNNDVDYDARRRLVKITLRSRPTRRTRLLRATDWLANRRLLSERAWYWIGRQLGRKPRRPPWRFVDYLDR